MATTIDGYLDAIATIVKALTVGVNPRFAATRVVKQPDFNLQTLAQVRRYPSCVLVDEGGSLNAHNGQYWRRRMGVFVADESARDPNGSDALERVLGHVEAITTALRREYTAGVLTLQAEDGFTVTSKSGSIVVVRALTYDVVLRRAS